MASGSSTASTGSLGGFDVGGTSSDAGTGGAGGAPTVVPGCSVVEPCDQPSPGVPTLLTDVSGTILAGGACLYIAKRESIRRPNTTVASLWAVPKTCGPPAQVMEPCAAAFGGPPIPSAALGPEHVYAPCYALGKLLRAPIAGGALETVFDQAVPRGMAADEIAVYFGTFNHELVKKPHDGGLPQVLHGPSSWLGEVELRDGFVYFAVSEQDFDPEAIYRVPVDGGPSEAVVLDAGGSIAALKVNATHVYWTAYDDAASTTSLNRAALDGTELAQLSNDWLIEDLALDDGYVYWTNYVTGSLSREPLGGGPQEILASGPELSSVHVDASAIYWSDHQGTWKLVK